MVVNIICHRITLLWTVDKPSHGGLRRSELNGHIRKFPAKSVVQIRVLAEATGKKDVLACLHQLSEVVTGERMQGGLETNLDGLNMASAGAICIVDTIDLMM